MKSKSDLEEIKNMVNLSKTKGFESKVIGKSVFNKTSEKDFYYLWLCELQRWLREEHSYFIYITPTLNSVSETEYKFTIYRLSDKFRLLPSGEKNTYVKALEKGLFKSLELI